MVVNTHILAQTNLVPNGSFEEKSTCPESNDLGDGQFERAIGWWSSSLGTPDYFHRCNDTLPIPSQGMVGVPNNFVGHQEPFHGDAYVGAGFLWWWSDSYQVAVAEYIQCELNSPLKKCVEYEFTMYVSMAEISPYATGKIGAHFSLTSYNFQHSVLIEKSAHVYNQNGIITDSINWVKIQERFVAEDNSRFMTIGYFFEGTDDTLKIQELNFADIGSYYYIDSVSLYEIGIDEECILLSQDVFLPNVFTPNGDGVNDVIDLSQWKEYALHCVIFDRWGKEVTELNEYNTIWDGTRKDGSRCTDGVYYYIFQLTTPSGKTIKKNGTIHILRNQ